MNTKVAIVTGSNKGIGFEIVKGLCEKFQGDVYLTARDTSRGLNAVAELKKLGFYPHFHQLDITDSKSIERLRDFIHEKYGGIDILVNNAAINYKVTPAKPFSVQAHEITFVNYFSVVSVCETLFPLLRPKSRVVNISSNRGHLSVIPSEEIRKKISDPEITVRLLSELICQFVESAKNGEDVEATWGKSPYSISKVALTALTFIYNRMYGSQGVIINSVHPGYVATDMTSQKGHLSAEQGASAPLYLALEASDDIKGQFVWCNNNIIDWYVSSPPVD